MASIEVENYKKSVKKITDRWNDKIKGPLKEIEDINKELATLDAKKDQLSDDEKKRHKELTTQREKCQKAVEKANLELKTDLMLIDPPTKAPKEELSELLKWMKSTYEKIKKGLPLADGFVLEPDVDFNFKKLKFEKLGVIFKWTF